ncbi:ATP-binding protein [Pontibacter silvestris]|uniref:histidine kinase n=1 Tax=Pontibacter silvestris TaxID=2305183 RepID=A0ABW4X0R4_9BACT|nr:ATP-binding protein [Pontibacter silvestris]MCC9135456.1 hypothetical protein [Pontibacter silvestris]
MEAHSIKLAMYLPDDTIQLLADPEMLEQVLINLIQNGMEACQHAAEPCIEVIAYLDSNEKDRLWVDVTDNGAGVPDDVIDKIFTPFYTTKKQGSGIG